MIPAGIHLKDDDHQFLITASALDFGASNGGVERDLAGQVRIAPAVSTGSDPITGSERGPSWGERWRWDDPFHAFGMVPMVGVADRIGVISASHLLDLVTWERQGIENPIQFTETKPGWLESHFP